MLQQCLLVGGFGGLGAITRFAVSTWISDRFTTHAGLGTLSVNVIGCLIGGILLFMLSTQRHWNESLRLALMVGFLGGFTTFSAFGCEVFSLLRDQRVASAMLLAAANVVTGVGSVAAGYGLARAFA